MAELKPFLSESLDKASIRYEWESWKRSFQICADNSETKNSLKKRTKLLQLGGPELQELAYTIPNALVDYEKEKNDVYKSLIDCLDIHFNPERNGTFERYLFRDMKMKEYETVDQFLMRLRHQAKKCPFEITKDEILEYELIGRIIGSCPKVELRSKLMEKEYTFDEIIGIWRFDEELSSQTKVMNKQHIIETNRVATNRTNRDECRRCGLAHPSTDSQCPALNVIYSGFHKKCHYRRKCRLNT